MEVTNIKTYMQSVGLNARNASRAVAKADTATKNRALQAMAEAIRRDERKLIDANQQDLDTARSKGLSSAMIDRLTLSTKGIQSMAEGLLQIAALADPIGEIKDLNFRPSGIKWEECACRWGSLASFTKHALM